MPLHLWASIYITKKQISTLLNKRIYMSCLLISCTRQKISYNNVEVFAPEKPSAKDARNDDEKTGDDRYNEKEPHYSRLNK